MKKKFKVGDRVRAINNKHCYTNKTNGFEGIVTKVYDSSFNAKPIKGRNCMDIDIWRNLRYANFELANQNEVHITVDGTTTYTILKENGKVVKRAEAKLSPEDEFNFSIGSKLAFERLFPKPQVKEVKRPAKVGEYIKVTNAFNTFGDYHNGDILKVSALYKDKGIEFERENAVFVSHNEYVVLENYEPEEVVNKTALYLSSIGKNCGKLGDPTPLKDVLGNDLFVGDVVKVFDISDSKLLSEKFIRKGTSVNRYQVANYGFSFDETGKDDICYIVKSKSYRDVKVGTNLYDTKVIEREE